MNLARRGILKAFGVGAVGLPAIAASAATSSLGAAGLSVAAGAYLGDLNTVPGGVNGSHFHTFANWLMAGGEEQMRRSAKEVRWLEPDLAMMCVPLQTKVIWQRERNYKRLLAENEDWFGRTLKRDGHVMGWF